MKVDLYDILNVSEDASQEEIKKSYRNLSKDCHPDVEGGNREEFEVLKNAYDTLLDPEKRNNYDQYGHDYESMPRIINCAVGLFKQALKRNSFNISEGIKMVYEYALSEIQSDIDDKRGKLEKYDKLLKRVKSAPKNDFISRMLNEEMRGYESGIGQFEMNKSDVKAAYEMLKGYDFEKMKPNVNTGTFTINVGGMSFADSIRTSMGGTDEY